MRFSLQDVKKTIHRSGGELAVSLHFLQPGELQAEIGRLIAYYEGQLERPQRLFSLDEARACIGDYRLAHCLMSALGNWYPWRQREWAELTMDGSPALAACASPVQLRLALYTYVNEHYQGFLETQARIEALHAFASDYHLSVPDLEYLLALDSEEEALLLRVTPQPPSVQDVATLYNQWVFEAALFNASHVRFVIDGMAFIQTQEPSSLMHTGIGAAIKRLCYLARRLGVYYDLETVPSDQLARPLLSLMLYGPQEVTGAPQQYGLRLTRLCRLLLDYGAAKSGRKQRASLAGAVVEAEATVHFLQRSYTFTMDARLLQLLPALEGAGQAEASLLFDSSIEQSFSEAFVALAAGQGVDGWHLEREPEPLLLDRSIFIPDFALTREQRRIYVEILGFWTPAYRERKLQKLYYLRGRDDLLLIIPIEAREAFASIAADFPIVYYDGQVSVTAVLQVLRSRYDDFVGRLERIDVVAVREHVGRVGLLVEQDCYAALHCYRRSEMQLAAERVVGDDIVFAPGIGLYQIGWQERLKQVLLAWLATVQPVALADVFHKLRADDLGSLACADTTIEALLSLWPELSVQRTSIFEAQVVLAAGGGEILATYDVKEAEGPPLKATKKPAREHRAALKKRAADKAATIQGNLWGDE